MAIDIINTMNNNKNC